MNRLDATLAALGLFLCVSTQAGSADAELDARFKALTSELRCLVCQNQTIADSNAALAVDLRNEVQRMLRDGSTDRAIIDYMVTRYGDFVLYRPPVNASTLPLWTAPALFLAAGSLGWLLTIRRSRHATSAELTAEEHARAAALLGEHARPYLKEPQA